jgi:hypothetical protein
VTLAVDEWWVPRRSRDRRGFGTDLAQGPVLGVQVSRTLYVHGATATSDQRGRREGGPNLAWRTSRQTLLVALLTTGVLAVVVASGWSSWLPHQPRNNSADRPGDGNT